MDDQESLGSEAAELSSMEGQVTAEQAIEMRIAAARQARTQSKQPEDFYSGDLGRIGSQQRDRIPMKLSYSSTKEAHPHQHEPVINTPPPTLDIDGLRLHNSVLESENDALKKKQDEATTVVMAVQHRHEANLIRLREKQAKQAAAISERDKKIHDMQQTIEKLTISNKSAEGAEEAYRGAVEKLKKKDKMIAEMRLTIDKQVSSKKKLEDEQAGKAKQYKQILTRVGGTRSTQDQELEAILSTIDMDAQRDDGKVCIEKLVAVITQAKSEIQRLRVHAARTNSPGAAVRNARTASPAVVRTNSPSGLRKKDSKDSDAWKTWMMKKKGQAAASAAATTPAIQHTDFHQKSASPAWRPGGLAKTPSQKNVQQTPVAVQEHHDPTSVMISDVTPPVRQTDHMAIDRADPHQQIDTKETRQPPPGLLALVGGSRPQAKPSPSDSTILTYGNPAFVTDTSGG